jgi:hypothetical protein
MKARQGRRADPDPTGDGLHRQSFEPVGIEDRQTSRDDRVTRGPRRGRHRRLLLCEKGY